MTDLAKMTWEEARELFVPDAVAILPVASTEPHGPHLPLDTDVTIALAQARRAVERLKEEGVTAFVLPPLAYGVTRFTTGFAGRVSLRPGTLWSLVEDVALSLEEDGVLRLVISNGHLEREHVKVLRGLAKDRPKVTEREAQILFPDNTSRRWAGEFGAEFSSGDCHAGSYESSIILAADPSSVREEKREALPEHQVGLLEKMLGGASSFLEIGADEAYCGAPAEASAEEGHELIERLSTMIVESVREAWPELFREATNT